MLNVTELASELQELTAWQETPMPLTDADYTKIVIRAVKKFFVDINHPEEYVLSLWITDEDDNPCYNREFNITEEWYILILCRIEFFKRVQTDVNNSFGYTTDALAVTNADKPYANLKDTLDNLEHERRIVFNKMVQYTLKGI